MGWGGKDRAWASRMTELPQMPVLLIVSSRALGKPLNLCEPVSFINKMNVAILRWFTEAYGKGVLQD